MAYRLKKENVVITKWVDTEFGYEIVTFTKEYDNKVQIFIDGKMSCEYEK